MITLTFWQLAVIVFLIVLIAFCVGAALILHEIGNTVVPKEWADNYKNFKSKKQ